MGLDSWFQFHLSLCKKRKHTAYHESDNSIDVIRFFGVLLLAYFSIPYADACTGRIAPTPMPSIGPTPRPNVTFHTYACPPMYASVYCLNGATCFTVKIGEHTLYNCECADGYMGPRCEFKDLDSSYLLSRKQVLLETASIAFGATLAILLVVIICASLYIRYNNKQKQKHMFVTCVDGPTRRKPFSRRIPSTQLPLIKDLSISEVPAAVGRDADLTLPEQSSDDVVDSSNGHNDTPHVHCVLVHETSSGMRQEFRECLLTNISAEQSSGDVLKRAPNALVCEISNNLLSKAMYNSSFRNVPYTTLADKKGLISEDSYKITQDTPHKSLLDKVLTKIEHLFTFNSSFIYSKIPDVLTEHKSSITTPFRMHKDRSIGYDRNSMCISVEEVISEPQTVL